MFRLIELSVGNFAIVKEDESRAMPINVHGFIHVIEYPKDTIKAYALPNISTILKESGEIEVLKAEALETTEESVAYEFGD